MTTDDITDETQLDILAEPPPIPRWTVLVVDDDPSYLADTAADIRETVRSPDGAFLNVLEASSFDTGVEILTGGTVDVVVLDVREQEPHNGASMNEDRGVQVFNALKSLRFLPVVFFTAVEARVADLEAAPLVQVVSKVEGSRAASEAVTNAFLSGVPLAVRALGDHVREVMRKYLWEHVAPKWADYEDAPRDQFANLLVGRLAKSLEHGVTDELEGALGGSVSRVSRWHPSRMYVLPPMDHDPTTGDLVTASDGTWYALLTPACDLVTRSGGLRKAEKLLLTTARPLFTVPVFLRWRAADRAWRMVEVEAVPAGGFSSERKQHRQNLKKTAKDLEAECVQILKGSNDRYFHLPAFLNIPDLLLDLQYIETPAGESLGSLTPVASLNPPYAQALLSRYIRYVGRIGLDDPDTDWLLERFRKDEVT